MNHDQSSKDIISFYNLVDIQLPVKSIRWEVFGTPEYTGGVPGPTDYVTLIAEVQPVDSKKIRFGNKAGIIWIVHEAARPWLSEEFHSMLAKYKNSSIDFSNLSNCKRLQGKLKKTRMPIDGFICFKSHKSLIYLTLSKTTEN